MPTARKTFEDVAPKLRHVGIPVTVTPKELSIGSGLGLTFIYDALRRGDLQGFRVGRRGWRIKSEEARRWIEVLAG